MRFLLSMPGGTEWLLLAVVVIILFIPYYFYVREINRLLLVISPQNRRMQPEKAWWLLIPFFCLVWHFLVVGFLTKSIEAEVKDLKIEVDETIPGFALGLATSIVFCLTLVPDIRIAAVLGSLILMQRYGNKLTSYRREFEKVKGASGNYK